jgi:hypothetical protein
MSATPAPQSLGLKPPAASDPDQKPHKNDSWVDPNDPRIAFLALINGFDTGTEIDTMDNAAFAKVGGEVVEVVQENFGCAALDVQVQSSCKVIVRIKVRGAEVDTLMRVIPGSAGMMLISEQGTRH